MYLTRYTVPLRLSDICCGAMDVNSTKEEEGPLERGETVIKKKKNEQVGSPLYRKTYAVDIVMVLKDSLRARE